MKSLRAIGCILLLATSSGLFSQQAVKHSIKSVEVKTYKAEIQNGAIIKGKPYNAGMLQNYYPISVANSCKEEYDAEGLLMAVTDYDDNMEPKAIEHYYYNHKKDIVKAVGFVPKYQDSMVGQWTYDSIGNLKKFQISKTKISSDNWFKKIFNKVYLSNYQNKDFHNYYLTNNDSANVVIKNEFETLKIEENDVYNLFDTSNRIVEKRVMETKNLNEANFIIKQMDTVWIKRELHYYPNGKVAEELTFYDRFINTRGRLKKQSKKYDYTEDNKLKMITTTAEYNPFKMTLMPKVKAKTIISKEIHEYLDTGKMQIIYFYEKDKLNKKVTEMFDSNGLLKEQISEMGKRKLQLKFDAHEKLVSYVRSNKKNKKAYDIKLEYTYNNSGDWTQCIHYDNLKNEPLFIEERTLEYY